MRTFHVDHTKWDRLGEVARSRNTNRAAVLRELIDSALEADRASWEQAA